MLETATMTIAEPSLSLKSLGMEVAMESPCAGRVHFLDFDDVITSFSALRASAPKSRSGLELELELADRSVASLDEALMIELLSSGLSVSRLRSTVLGRASGLRSLLRDSVVVLVRSFSGAILLERSCRSCSFSSRLTARPAARLA